MGVPELGGDPDQIIQVCGCADRLGSPRRGVRQHGLHLDRERLASLGEGLAVTFSGDLGGGPGYGQAAARELRSGGKILIIVREFNAILDRGQGPLSGCGGLRHRRGLDGCQCLGGAFDLSAGPPHQGRSSEHGRTLVRSERKGARCGIDVRKFAGSH